jgi:hypothetical protein
MSEITILTLDLVNILDDRLPCLALLVPPRFRGRHFRFSELQGHDRSPFVSTTTSASNVGSLVLGRQGAETPEPGKLKRLWMRNSPAPLQRLDRLGGRPTDTGSCLAENRIEVPSGSSSRCLPNEPLSDLTGRSGVHVEGALWETWRQTVISFPDQPISTPKIEPTRNYRVEEWGDKPTDRTGLSSGRDRRDFFKVAAAVGLVAMPPPLRRYRPSSRKRRPVLCTSRPEARRQYDDFGYPGRDADRLGRN